MQRSVDGIVPLCNTIDSLYLSLTESRVFGDVEDPTSSGSTQVLKE